jgi:hypothetical protein
MKHHVHTLICLICLASTWLLCSCRTTYQNDRSTQEQCNLSTSDSTVHDRSEDYYSRFNLSKEQNEKGWKVKVKFDTTQPSDSVTGLPPISGIEIEGCKNTIKTLLQKDDSAHVTNKEEKKTAVTLQQNKQSESHKDISGSVATGIDDGLKYGLMIGIPIILIIIIFISYARYRQKNPSK